MNEINIAQSRFRDVPWFNRVSNEFLIAGLGGTGSWIAMLLSRILNKDDLLLLIDYDRFEEVNMAGQFVFTSQVNLDKTEAIYTNITKFSKFRGCYYLNTKISEDITFDTSGYNFVFSCFDNMKARKILFEAWVNNIDSNKQFNCFIDPRLEAENFQIYFVTPDRIDDYRKTLVDDNEIPSLSCTLKQTSHTAAILAGLTIALVTNHITNINYGEEVRNVPFLSIFNNLNLEYVHRY